MLVYLCLGGLSQLAVVIHVFAKRAESRMEMGADATKFHRFQRRYFVVYFMATFADWLQGPYVYKLYSHYGYAESQIAVLYVVGFVASVTFGTFVGSLADRFGRKKLCVVYCVLYSFCCLTKLTPDYRVLVAGRFFGGISTSILFSTFEAWYVHEHVRRNFPPQWINLTVSKSTFYNAILAIFAGIIANLVAETLRFGPVAPFVVAIPFLIGAAVLTQTLWNENDLKLDERKAGASYFTALRLIFTSKNSGMLRLGTIQSIFESVMYTFVFLWTPVLGPMSPPLGIVFSCFMIAIMIGSSLYFFLSSRNCPPERLLRLSLYIALISLSSCTLATAKNSETYAQFSFVSFLVYEVAVGMYFPAVSYLRSRVVPEEYRAGITNWFRVPMNLMVCTSLLLLREDKKAVTEHDSSHLAFLFCSCFLAAAIVVSVNFTSTPRMPIEETKQEQLI